MVLGSRVEPHAPDYGNYWWGLEEGQSVQHFANGGIRIANWHRGQLRGKWEERWSGGAALGWHSGGTPYPGHDSTSQEGCWEWHREGSSIERGCYQRGHRNGEWCLGDKTSRECAFYKAAEMQEWRHYEQDMLSAIVILSWGQRGSWFRCYQGQHAESWYPRDVGPSPEASQSCRKETMEKWLARKLK